MHETLLIIGMGVVTFATRYPLLALVGRVQLPRRVFAALRFVPVAVLTAIIAPAMLRPEGHIALTPENSYLVGGLVAMLIAWYSRNLLYTIAGGLAFFLLWRAIIGG